MSGFLEIDVDDAQEHHRSESATFLDIRDPQSFSASHIRGAVHLSDANIEEVVASLDPKRPLIVYCYHGNSSRGGAGYFSSQGFAEVYSLRGGYEAWCSSTPDDT